MKWFRHMVATWDDENISLFVDEHGLAGYGFWWRLLEIVAAQIDESDRTEVTFPASKWGKMFGTYPKVFRKFCESLQNHSLIILEDSEISITVKIPNLLKYRDEWTKKKVRNSGVNLENIRSKHTESYTDTEIEDSPSISPSLPTPHSMPDKPPCPPPEQPSMTEHLFEPEEPVPKPSAPLKTSNRPNDEADHGKQNRKQQRGTRLAADWQPSLEDWQFAAENGYTGAEAATTADKFQDYWHSKAGAAAVKLDWSATWRNWVRREIEDRGNRGYQRKPEPRFNNPFCELIASGEGLSGPDGLPDY